MPDANALKTAELGLNLVDQKLYSKDANGTVFEIGQAGDTPNGPTPPSDDNQLGDLFFDTFNNILLYWNGVEWVPVGNEAIALNDLTDVDTSGVTDGMVLAYNGSSWVPYDMPPGTVVSETAPADPEEGQLWWADSTVEEGGGRLYVWTGSEWVDASQPGSGSDFDQAQADALYLSKVNDDTAAGALTFKGKTNHGAGITLTGGTSDDVVDGLKYENDKIVVVAGTKNVASFSDQDARTIRVVNDVPYSDTTSVYNGILITTTPDPVPGFTDANANKTTESIRITPVLNDANSVDSIYRGVRFDANQLRVEDTNKFTSIHAFSVSGITSAKVADDYPGIFAAYYADVPSGGNNKYSYYSPGSAPSFFRGDVETGALFRLARPGVRDSTYGILYQNASADNNYGIILAQQLEDGTRISSYALGATHGSYTKNHLFKIDEAIVFRITSSGPVTRNLILETEADDEAAYQTTYDAEGVAETTYVGETLDLLATIRELKQAKADFEARLAALEGA